MLEPLSLNRCSCADELRGWRSRRSGKQRGAVGQCSVGQYRRCRPEGSSWQVEEVATRRRDGSNVAAPGDIGAQLQLKLEVPPAPDSTDLVNAFMCGTDLHFLRPPAAGGDFSSGGDKGQGGQLLYVARHSRTSNFHSRKFYQTNFHRG